ncbi:MAG: calcium-binding protein, partial [Dolichospermum sp.]
LISIDTSNTTNQLDIPGTTVFGFERFDLTSFAGTISFDGTTGNDWIKAGTGDDILIAGDGNDYLNGGVSADLLIGGKGNDTYMVDNVGDVIAEGLNGGIDTVESSITWTLRANLENLTLQGTTAINGTGNNLNNIMTGNTGNNVLNGGLGNDTLIGGLGNDTLIGRLGNDSYYVDNAADIIKENANAGTDSVFSTAATYTLRANVENLTLQGTTAINGTGNTLNNIITGNVADNVLTGNAGADTLTGGVGNDSLYLGLNDNVVDNVNYVFGDGTDTVYQFVRGVGGDKLNFTGIANFDVITSGTSTLVRVGDGIAGNTDFGTGQLLVTLSGTSGFNSTNANLNLFGGTFLFS